MDEEVKDTPAATAEVKAATLYELTIPFWQCVVQPDWKLEMQEGEDWVNPGPILVSRARGARIRSGGGPEAAYLAAMLEHGYLKEVEAGASAYQNQNALV